MNAPATVLGIGTATPACSLDQNAAAAFAIARCCSTDRQRTWLRRVYGASGVKRRASALLIRSDEPTASEGFYPPPVAPADRGPTTAVRLERYAREAGGLAESACRAAFSEAGIESTEITHLVTVSCTGFFAPGVEMELITRLGLAPNVGRLNLGFMGCHAALNALGAARAFANGTPGARVLVCCVELCTLHFGYGWNTQRVVANALFADGAAAAIIGPANGDGLRLIDTASLLTRDSQAAMTWRIGDYGFDMGLSPAIPRLIRSELENWLTPWLAEHELGIDEVKHWAIHPGGPKIIDAVIEALGLPAAAGDASRAVLAAHGNMSSPTVLFVLQALHPRAGAEPCVALGFGPGLVFEAALFR